MIGVFLIIDHFYMLFFKHYPDYFYRLTFIITFHFSNPDNISIYYSNIVINTLFSLKFGYLVIILSIKNVVKEKNL